MPQRKQVLQEDNQEPKDQLKLTDEAKSPTLSHPAPQNTVDQPELPASAFIPIEDDVTYKVDEVNQAAEVAAKMTPEVKSQVDAVLRSYRQEQEETVEEYNERVKREFTHAVLEARRLAATPPPPPQPVAPAILEQTQREIEAGRKQSAYWAEQQKNRPAPNARDIAAAGTMTEVFAPDRYTHERGEGIEGKAYTRTNIPSR